MSMLDIPRLKLLATSVLIYVCSGEICITLLVLYVDISDDFGFVIF